MCQIVVFSSGLSDLSVTDVCPHFCFVVLPVKSRLCCLSGRCDPDDLKVEEDERRLPAPPLPPARLPDPPRPAEEEEDPVTDIEAELLWENQPHPPRGDVPNRRPYLDYGDGEPQDQAARSYGQIHYRQLPGTGRTGSTGHRHGGLKVSVALIKR